MQLSTMRCIRCQYETDKKSAFIRHLQRKTICKLMDENVSFNDFLAFKEKYICGVSGLIAQFENFYIDINVNIEELYTKVFDEYYNYIYSSFKYYLDNMIRNEISEKLRLDIKCEILKSINLQLNDKLKNKISNELCDEIYENIYNNIKVDIINDIDKILRKNVGDALRQKIKEYNCDMPYDFCKTFGDEMLEILREEFVEKVRKQINNYYTKP